MLMNILLWFEYPYQRFFVGEDDKFLPFLLRNNKGDIAILQPLRQFPGDVMAEW